MQHKKIEPSKSEQDREELEKLRSGMPGAIRRNRRWSREREDGKDTFIARMESPELHGWDH